MELEVIEFVNETWAKASNILDTYTLPLDIEAKMLELRKNIEALSSAIHGE